ncbi:hypothetical protein Lal_00020549 [Lupinus albus]|uniref:Uncharacterized protein n=1 Tax=Lupinus albus TaxID=3870 RepID=A0A6A5MAZ3_LUPAL|nr:hypothetical protein Lalb_Chr08g0243531 [Lupinus albus]KAF1871754.1 hypothetical protein Lal_00020549 [Lupinus albus]
MTKPKLSGVIRQLERAKKKLKSLLPCWRVTSSKQRWSRFLRNDHMSLQSLLEDKEIKKDHTQQCKGSMSYASEDDIDKRADIFIARFHRHLIMEKTLSLDLNQCTKDGFEDHC